MNKPQNHLKCEYFKLLEKYSDAPYYRPLGKCSIGFAPPYVLDGDDRPNERTCPIYHDYDGEDGDGDG